jgi:hypothetical protein
MKTRITTVARGVWVILIAGAMVFGAREAFAGTRDVSRRDCLNGHCATQKECDDCCIALGNGGGTCYLSGACLCW